MPFAGQRSLYLLWCEKDAAGSSDATALGVMHEPMTPFKAHQDEAGAVADWVIGVAGSRKREDGVA